MASRHGNRISGTDGNDFLHRERIAPQYNVSAQTKKWIRFVYGMHFLIWTLMVLRLLPEICLRFGVKVELMTKIKLPIGELWEYVWMVCSPTPTLFGFLSLGKNRVTLLRLAMTGCLIFNLAPIMYAIFDQSPSMYQYYLTRKVKSNIFGFPMIVLKFMFFAVCLQVHGFTLYFGKQLLNSWSVTASKKKS